MRHFSCRSICLTWTLVNVVRRHACDHNMCQDSARNRDIFPRPVTDGYDRREFQSIHRFG
jgi:hypothetical protein